MEYRNLVKGRPRCNTVNQQKSLSRTHYRFRDQHRQATRMGQDVLYCSRIAPYSSCPAVSSTSSRATSSSIKHCLRYESSVGNVSGRIAWTHSAAYRLLGRILMRSEESVISFLGQSSGLTRLQTKDGQVSQAFNGTPRR
jgi:hypothetical protein